LFTADIHARYRGVIQDASRKAFKATRKTARDYELEDIRAMAIEIAADRHELWDRGDFPAHKDLDIQLRRVIRADRYARGWRQTTNPETGRREWVRPKAELRLNDDRAVGQASWLSEPYRVLFGADEGPAYALAADWPPFTPGQRRRFARFMEARYPEVCRAFEALDGQVKPAAMAWLRWERHREKERARLRVVFARELAEARFAVTYGGLEIAA
jgi:hypothetical protein